MCSNLFLIVSKLFDQYFLSLPCPPPDEGDPIFPRTECKAMVSILPGVPALLQLQGEGVQEGGQGQHHQATAQLFTETTTPPDLQKKEQDQKQDTNFV